MSNIRKGNAFRDKIRDLCTAAGHQPITELYVRGKKSDVGYQVFAQPRTKTIVVEAKSISGALQKKSVSEIIGSYVGALNHRDVDEVWVVSEFGFSSEARHALEENAGFFALSFDEFLRTLINFPAYHQFLRLQIEQDGILDYYIPQRFVKLGRADRIVDRWLYSSSGGPLAVLSSYGMGKSSLCKVVAYRYLAKLNTEPTHRIPIIIKLSNLSSQQRIEGLLGSIFTSDVSAAGYNFPLFQKMNSLGQFLLLFDGLDEMRHGMTWEEFRYNIKEVSRLIFPQTKAILFGRPNVFRNELEYQLIIRGMKFVDGKKYRSLEQIQFDPIELKPFSPKDVYDYLERYINHVRKSAGVATSANEVAARVREIRGLKVDDLIVRPVHAQMIAEMAANFDTALSKLSRFKLYDQFIDFILERDFKRSERMGLAPEQRRKFLRKFACALWFEMPDSSLKAQGATEEHGYALGFSARADERAERAQLSGPLLESKYGEQLYFSHRSFQEFLIAEAITNLELDVQAIGDKVGLISDNILQFMCEADNLYRLVHFFEAFVRNTSHFTNFNLDLARVLYRTLRQQKRITRAGQLARSNRYSQSDYLQAPLLIYCWANELAEISPFQLEKLDAAIDHIVASARVDSAYFYLAAQILFDLYADRRSEVTKRYVARKLIAILIRGAASELQLNTRQRLATFLVRPTKGLWGALLRNAVTFELSDKKQHHKASINPTLYYRTLKDFSKKVSLNAAPDLMPEISIGVRMDESSLLGAAGLVSVQQ